MSFNDVYEFIQGEYQQVTRIRQEPVSTADPVFFKDLNLVKWAGYSNEIWSAETGGTQLVQGLDYELQYLDVAASGPAGEPVYSGYSILTPLYYNIPLYQTANIVGAYTTRPYRPSYNVITADTTVTPASMDDSVIADATGGSFTVTIADGFHLNQRYSIICKGLGTVTVVGTGISAAAFTGVGVSWLWDGGEWMPLAAPGAREGGFYYDYVPAFIRPDTDPISATIPDFLATYGSGFFYIGLEFTYQGTTDKTNGTFAIADDDIDKYAVLAVDVAGGDSTLSIQWQWDTDTMVAIETGTDFTDLNLWAVYRWEKVTYGGYGAWANTAEAPPYGEAITSEQELYLDGTKEFVSSDGNAPVVDVVDYLPAVINVDGVETPEANSKWPGQRGTYGFFGEYSNDDPNPGFSSTNGAVTVTTEGNWKKLLSSVATDQYTSDNISKTAGDSLYVTATIRRGNTDDPEIKIQGNVAPLTEALVLQLAFNTKTFTITGDSAIDAGSEYITDDIFILRATGIYTTTETNYRNKVRPSVSQAITGAYVYIRQFAFYPVPYPVPYVAGTHQPAKLQFNKDWAESTDWTIQGWFKVNTAGTINKTIFVSGSAADQHIRLIVSSSLVLTLVANDGAPSNTTGSTVAVDTFYHVNVVYDSTGSVNVYLNGALDITHTTNIPLSSDIAKLLPLGSQQNYTQPLEGYLQDFTIQPGIDTSDAHYLSGLPWYSPGRTYGKNASWSIDSRGNISGNNQVAGSIIQDEEINGQRIVRWDTGLMMIFGTTYWDTIAIATVSGALFRSITGDGIVPFVSAFTVEPNITCTVRTEVNTNIISCAIYSKYLVEFRATFISTVSTGSTSVELDWQATGRWK